MSMDDVVKRLFHNIKEVNEDEWLKLTISNLKRGFFPRYNYNQLLEYLNARTYKLYIVDRKHPMVKVYESYK